MKTQIQSGRADGSKSGLVQAKGYAQRRANIAGIVGCAHFDRPVDHSWSPDPLVHYSLNSPSWSLSDELFLYALFPWLLKWREPVLRAVFIAGMVLIVAGSCFTALTVAGYSPWVDWIFYVFPLTRLFEFIAGILLCRAWRSGIGRRWATSATEALAAISLPATMVAVEWFAVPLAFRYQLIFLPPMAVLILIFAHGQGALSHLLRQPGLQSLGAASFALYLVHRPMITFMERWSGAGAASDIALAITMLPMAMLASIPGFALLDRPVQHWLRRRETFTVKRKAFAIRQ